MHAVTSGAANSVKPPFSALLRKGLIWLAKAHAKSLEATVIPGETHCRGRSRTRAKAKAKKPVHANLFHIVQARQRLALSDVC
eukprot:1948381-Pyramimonas_sp.AAC.1